MTTTWTNLGEEVSTMIITGSMYSVVQKAVEVCIKYAKD